MSAHPRQVVVIEDEEDVLELLRDVMESEGYSVIAIPSPSLIQSSLVDVRPNLFLVDMMLPGISGVELTQQLRAGRFPQEPMVAMSASPLMLELAAESRLFQEILSKPFDLSALLACVERYAGSPEYS